MSSFCHDLPFGAAFRDGFRTDFRIWAPGIETLTLQIEGREDVVMTPRADGWHETSAPCPAGSLYRYRLPDGTFVADPACRAQNGDVDGFSVVIDPRSYHWLNPGWTGRPWHETVLYEIHVGLAGGFAGVERQLAGLADLGITAIELMPIADFSGTRNWGYDGVLLYAPAEAYGTPDDLKRLVDTAHGLGLGMFLDVVYNHFGPDGAAISQLAPEAFRSDIQTPWGDAIDFRSAPMRDLFIQNALYWLEEYRFDGLRFDAVHSIHSDVFPEAMAAAIRRAIAPGRHVHLVLENENNDARLLASDFDAQWNDDLHHCLHVLLTGETHAYYVDFCIDPAAQLAKALAEGFVFQGEMSSSLGRPRGSPSGHLAPTAFVGFLQNHDQVGNRASGERLTTLANADVLKVATALVLLAPQIPLIFMGEEIGAKTPFLYFTDYDAELGEAVSEGRKQEFASQPGFSDEDAKDVADVNAPQTFDAAAPSASDQTAQASRAFYRKLLDIRRRSIVPRLEGARSLGATSFAKSAVLARWTMGDGTILTIAANFSADPVAIAWPGGESLFAYPENLALSHNGDLPGRSFVMGLG